MRLVAEWIGKPLRSFHGRVMEWMYNHNVRFAKIRKSANMTKTSLNYFVIVKIIKEKFGVIIYLLYLCRINITTSTMTFTEKANKIFNQAIRDYHLKDHVDTPISNPYERDSIEYSLYLKCWIDTVQWHLEDIIRDPHIDPAEALGLKRRIDRSNQDRTDLVEEIDTYFRKVYADVKPQADARLNTESPAWATDRLSILALKIWHMKEQTERKDADAEHVQKCQAKLDVLLEQQVDLSTAIDQLLEDIEAGRKYMKVYRQMKMYNDPATNPVLYKK
jgi:hypothetical protein